MLGLSKKAKLGNERAMSKQKKTQKTGGIARLFGKKRRLGFLAALLALVLALTGCGLLDGSQGLNSSGEETEDEGPYIEYAGARLPILEDVPVNNYRIQWFVEQDGRMTYESSSYRTETGVDVSTFQGEVDWAAVAADGIDFAILRAGFRGYTEGVLEVDERFLENLEGATAAGLKVGVYFFSQAVNIEEAVEEAEFVLNLIQGYTLEYPIVFDWEHISDPTARTAEVTGETLTDCAAAFCQRVEEAGYEAMVYFYRHLGYVTYDLSELTDYGFWFADYNSFPNFYYSFDMWQYSNTGTVDGISVNVDLNLRFFPVESGSSG